MTTKSTERRERYQVQGELDARDAEALRLELVWLARRRARGLRRRTCRRPATHPPKSQEDVTMPSLQLRGKLVRVSFNVKRPMSKPGLERLRKAMEKVVRRYGGKVR